MYMIRILAHNLVNTKGPQFVCVVVINHSTLGF
jgi:hypothetical protein